MGSTFAATSNSFSGERNLEKLLFGWLRDSAQSKFGTPTPGQRNQSQMPTQLHVLVLMTAMGVVAVVGGLLANDEAVIEF